MLRRIAAVAFAATVIVGALAIRNDRRHSDPPAPAPAPAPNTLPDDVDPYEAFDDDSVTVLCAEELLRLCEALPLVVSVARIESAWVTADRLAAGGDLGADAWLTLRPMEELAASRAPASRSALGAATPFVRSAIVLAGPSPAMAAVEQACPDPRTLLACAGSAAQPLVMLRDPKASPAGAVALAALATELGVPSQAPSLADPAARQRLLDIVGRGRLTPVPYEDVARLKGNAVALTVEADVGAATMGVAFKELEEYGDVAVLYPFEARAVEVVMAPARSFRRAGDLAKVLRSPKMAYTWERAGFDVPPRRPPFLQAKKVFARRPTIRSDLPPPSPGLLRDLRALVGSPERQRPAP